MVAKKASLEDIIEDLEDGMTFKEIADKHGYKNIQTISHRLRNNNIHTRSSITKNPSNYSGDKYAGLISIPYPYLKDYDGMPYYEIREIESYDEDGLKIIFKDSRVYKEEED